MKDFDQFLNQFAGDVESEGVFRVALDKARHKLQKFQLANPQEGVLELFAAAHLSGAKKFEVTTDKVKVTFEFDGKPFAHHELEDLEGYLYGVAGDRRLYRLAVALAAFEALDFDKVDLSTAPKIGHTTLALTLKSAVGLAWSFGGQNLTRRMERCLHSPTVVSVDNKRQEFKLPSGRWQSWQVVSASLGPQFSLGHRIINKVDTEAPFNANLIFSTPGSLEVGFQAVVDGVAYQCDHALLGNRYFQAVVASPNFRLDLSHSGPVINGEFLEIVRAVQETCNELLWQQTLKQKIEKISLLWSEAVKISRAYYAEHNQLKRAHEIDRWLVDWDEEVKLRNEARRKARERVAAKKAERRLQEAIERPTLACLSFADELIGVGRHEDANRLRENYGLKLARVCLDTTRIDKLKKAIKTALEFLARYPVLPRLRELLGSFDKQELRLPPLEDALFHTRFDEAVKFAEQQPDQDFLIGCLHLSNRKKDKQLALDLESTKAAETMDPCLKAMRLVVLHRRARGHVFFVEQVRLRLVTSWHEHLARYTEGWTTLPVSLRELLKDGVVQPLALVDLDYVAGDKELRRFCETQLLFEMLHQRELIDARELLNMRAFETQAIRFKNKVLIEIAKIQKSRSKS